MIGKPSDKLRAQIDTLRAQGPWFQAFLLFSTLAPLYLLSYTYRLSHPYGLSTTTYHHDFTPPSSPSFEEIWLETPLLPEPFNPTPLRRYCNDSAARVHWHPHQDVIFRLPDANGGIGTIRGNILDFVMYAIEAGATTMVLPSMARRDEADIFNVWAGRQEFETFFDEAWFVEAMGEICPRMRIVREREGGESAGAMFYPPSRRTDFEGMGITREEYVQDLGRWTLEQGWGGGKDEIEIDVERSLWQFDTFGVAPGLRRELGFLLRFREDVREFAAEVVKNLGLLHGLGNLDASQAIPERVGGRFFGGHLRTEIDAVKAGFVQPGITDPDIQTNAMIQHALKRNLTTLYIATGSPDDLDAFRKKCAQNKPPLNVTSKFDLLSKASASELRKMTWDQQALVDYEVLLRSTFFMGMSRSSFSFQIAVTRNQNLKDVGRITDPYEVVQKEPNVAFEDSLSRITGLADGFNERIPRGMWP